MIQRRFSSLLATLALIGFPLLASGHNYQVDAIRIVHRNGPQSLGSGKSEISRRFQAARSRVACSKYTASGVRPSSAL